MQHDPSLAEPNAPWRPRRHRPQLGRNIVLRPRLHTRLDGALTVPLTLLAAPAGFGKTTLLLAWAAEQTAPIIWLTADHEARALGHFLTQISTAILELLTDLPLGLTHTLAQARELSPRQAGITLANALHALRGDLIVIIDDYHDAASPDVEGFLGGLLHEAPPYLHLTLATRADPALPLARMRLHDDLLELRATDLRFTEEETGALLTAAGVAGDTTLVARLQEQSEGWVAGLKLATLALPGKGLQDHPGTPGDGQQHMMDFLVEEVLANLSPPAQAFLLHTSIVDAVSAPLADAILGDAPEEGSLALLRRLVRDGLGMAEPREDGEWFRVHPLFRSLLLHHLEVRISPPERSVLHQRAAAWFSQAGLLDEAIHHFLAANDAAAAAQLVTVHAHGALNREDWQHVARWLHLLPDSAIHADPRLLVTQASVSHISGRLASVRMQTEEIKALLPGSGLDDATCAIISAECDALSLVQLSEFAHDPQRAVDLAERAIAQIPPEHGFLRGLAYFAYGGALRSAGRADEAVRWLTATAELDAEQIDARAIRALLSLVIIHRQTGNFRACANVAHQVLRLAERHTLPLAAGWARWALGWLAFERNALDEALTHFTANLANARALHLSAATEISFGLARVYQALGQREEADAAVRHLLEIILDARALEYLPTIRAFEAHLALLRQEREEAITWLRAEPDVSIASNVLTAFEHDLFTRIKALLAEGSDASLAAAWEDVTALRGLAEARHHRAPMVEIHALTAMILAAQGADEEAMAELRIAVALGEANGHVRTFLDLGPALRSLLGRLDEDHVSPYIASLLAAFVGHDSASPAHSEAAPRQAAIELGALTLRESDVLHALARRLSYQEIGDELFISAHTVKSHATHIYEKLGVANRREALAKAQALGWVS